MTRRCIILLMAASYFVLTGCGGQDATRNLLGEKNLERWKSAGELSLNDGVLTLNGGDKMVFSGGKYTDFELLVSLRTSDGGKGEIKFHADENSNGGYSIAVDNDRDNDQWWTRTGSLLAVRNLAKSIVEDGQWFDLSIKVYGKEITVHVNDELLVEYVEPENPFRTAHHAGQVLSSGTFAIECSDGSIQFDRLEVMGLKVDKSVVDRQLAEAVDEQEDGIIRLHQANFPVLDYHVHLKEDLTLELAKSQSRKLGINYALAPNCGVGFPITTDAQVVEYLEGMKGQPFLQAMQGEGREWATTFSESVRMQFDYVFTDALTFTDRKGNRTRLWMPDEVFIDDEQKYMDLIVEKICRVILDEPMDIYVNPNFLPDVMNDRYDMFWTDERQNKVIDALVSTGKVLEINQRYKIPNRPFIQKAKDAGLKFSFGTNNADSKLGKLEYCIQMAQECGITAQDMYNPIKH